MLEIELINISNNGSVVPCTSLVTMWQFLINYLIVILAKYCDLAVVCRAAGHYTVELEQK